MITPKLLPGLDYTELTKVHFIYNGAAVPSQEQWEESHLCTQVHIKIPAV